MYISIKAFGKKRRIENDATKPASYTCTYKSYKKNAEKIQKT